MANTVLGDPAVWHSVDRRAWIVRINKCEGSWLPRIAAAAGFCAAGVGAYVILTGRDDEGFALLAALSIAVVVLYACAVVMWLVALELVDRRFIDSTNADFAGAGLDVEAIMVGLRTSQRSVRMTAWNPGRRVPSAASRHMTGSSHVRPRSSRGPRAGLEAIAVGSASEGPRILEKPGTQLSGPSLMMGS